MPDPRDFLFNTAYKMDQIIFSKSGTITVAASTTENVTIPNTIGATTLFTGYFNVDGGNANNTIPSFYAIGEVADVNAPYVSIEPTVTNTDITLSVENTDSSSHSVQYDIYLLAKSNQGEITPDLEGSGFSFNTNRNYLKIAFDDIANITIPAATSAQIFQSISTTIPHNLGYAPNFRSFIEYNGAMRLSDRYSSADRIISAVSVDDNNLYIELFNWATGSGPNQPTKDVQVHYRVYYDN